MGLVWGLRLTGIAWLQQISIYGVTIEKGKLADLVVLDDNLFEIDSDKIWKVKPAAVLMEGEVIQGALPGGNQK